MEGVGKYTNERRIGKRGWHVEKRFKLETMHIIVCFLGGLFVCLFFFFFLGWQKSKFR